MAAMRRSPAYGKEYVNERAAAITRYFGASMARPSHHFGSKYHSITDRGSAPALLLRGIIALEAEYRISSLRRIIGGVVKAAPLARNR